MHDRGPSGVAIFPLLGPILCEDYPPFDPGRQDIYVCIPGCMFREKPPPDSALETKSKQRNMVLLSSTRHIPDHHILV